MSKVKKKSVITIAFWYLMCNFLTAGISFITTPIFARMLTTEQYGEFVNFTSWESILFAFVSAQMFRSVARAKFDYSDYMDQYISTITIFSSLVCILMYSIIEIGRSFFEKMFSMDITYIRILFVYMLFLPVFNNLQAKYRIYSEYKAFVFTSVFSATIRVIASVFAVSLMQDKFMGRVLGYALPMMIFCVYLWISVVFRGRAFDIRMLKYSIVIAFPLIPHALSGIVLSSSDRLMIKNICGSEDAAFYSVAYTVSSIINLVWIAANYAWVPWMYDRLCEEKYKEVREKSTLLIACFVVFYCLVILIFPEFLLFMGGNKYLEAISVMPIVAAGLVFQFMYGFYADIEQYEKKTWFISIGTFMAALFNVVLNYMLIPKFGYIAAAYTTLIGYSALLIFHWNTVRKMDQYKGIYNVGFIFGGATLTTVISIVCSTLYSYSYVYRYMILIVSLLFIGIIAYIKRNSLNEIIKNLMQNK